MKKIFCDFRNQGDDNYCDIHASKNDISKLIAAAMSEYQKRLTANGKELFKYSKIEKCNIFNLPVSFDIETTSIAETKSALPYIWQIAIYETCFYGRFIDDFPEFIDLLDNILATAKVRKSKARNGLIIYVHNLSFEFQFIRTLFKIVPDSFLNYDKRDIIKFEIESLNRIMFRCSYQLTRKPLRELSNSRNILKLSPIDYSLARSPETPLTRQELDYALYDVLVMNLYFDDLMIIEGKNLSEVPYTLTGYARNYFKEQCGFRLNSNEEIPDNVKLYRRILSNCKLPEYADLALARHCFQGGFTHASIAAYNCIHEDVFHFDLSSSYPTVLLSELYPVCTFSVELTKLKVLFKENENFVNDMLRIPSHIWHSEYKIGYVMRICLKNITLKHGKNECIISYSKIFNGEKTKENPCRIDNVINGRVQAGDNIQLFITDIDFDLIKMFYDFDYEVLNIFFAHFDYLPEVFCKTIADLYKDKTTLKGVSGKESDYALKKIVLNSIYGLCVTDPIPDDYIYDNKDKKLNKIDPTDESIREKLSEYNATAKPKKINFYFWGVFCTAYARYNLITMIDKLGLDYLYADTDSVFFTGEKNLKYINDYNEEIVKKLVKNPHVTYQQIAPKDIKGKVHILGQWTQERFCNKFVTIGAKRYLEIYPCNYKFTCAGIKPEKLKLFFKNQWREYFRKNYHFTTLQEFRDFDYFEKRHEFIAEAFNDVYNGAEYQISDCGKQKSYFNDEEVTGVLTDYLGNKYEYHIKSSLNLSDTTFNLTMFDISNVAISLNEQYKIFKKSGVVDNELL